MGWLFSHRTRDAQIQELVQDPNCLDHTDTGERVWAVWRSADNSRFIACFLIDQQDGKWGYKPIDETMGPCFYDCPLKYLDATPGRTEGYAAAWREKVRAYHAGKTVPTGGVVVYEV